MWEATAADLAEEDLEEVTAAVVVDSGMEDLDAEDLEEEIFG